MTGYFQRMASRTGLVQPAGDGKDDADSPVAPLEVHDMQVTATPARRDTAPAPGEPGAGDIPSRHSGTILEAPAPTARRTTATDPDRPKGADPAAAQRRAMSAGTSERSEDAVERPVPAPTALRSRPAQAPPVKSAVATPPARSETPERPGPARMELAMARAEPDHSSPSAWTPAVADEAIQDLSEQIFAETPPPLRVEAQSESPIGSLKRATSTERPTISHPMPAASRPGDSDPGGRRLPRPARQVIDSGPRPAIPLPRNRDQAPSIRIGNIRVEVHGPEAAPEPQAPVAPMPEAPPRPPAMRRFYVRA